MIHGFLTFSNTLIKTQRIVKTVLLPDRALLSYVAVSVVSSSWGRNFDYAAATTRQPTWATNQSHPPASSPRTPGWTSSTSGVVEWVHLSILFLPCPCYYSPLPPHHSTYLQSSSCDFLAYRSSTSALPLPPGSVLFRPPTAHPPTNFSIRAQVTTLHNKLMSSRSRRRRFENTPFSRFFSNLNIG